MRVVWPGESGCNENGEVFVRLFRMGLLVTVATDGLELLMVTGMEGNPGRSVMFPLTVPDALMASGFKLSETGDCTLTAIDEPL